MKNINLKVEGMMCEGCEKRIQNSLNKIDKIKQVNANHKEGNIVIIAEEGVDEKEIKEKIEDIGFKVK